MAWPREFTILWGLFHNAFFISWVIAAAGIIFSVLLHRKEKKPLFWPAVCAAVLWFACEVAEANLSSFMGEFIALVLGLFAFGYGAGWLVMDVVYLLKK